MVQRMGVLMFALIKQELCWMLMWRSTYPYRFAALLHDSVGSVANELQVFKQTWQAWKVAQQSKQPFWKRLVKSCTLQWTICSDTWELLEQEGWQYSGKVKTQVERMWLHNMSTITVERAFRECRDHERENPNKEQSPVSLWRKPTMDGVLGTKHKFKEVDGSSIPHHEVGHEHLPKAFFAPLFRKSSDSFKALPGRGKPDWATMRPVDIPFLGANTDMLRWAFTNDMMDKGPASWKSCLASPGTLLQKAGSSKAWFSLGYVGPLVYMWPAVSVKVGKSTCWCFKHDGSITDMMYEPILDLSLWKVLPVELKSPAGLFILNNRKPLESMPQLPAVQTGSAMPLLKWAAKSAFKGLSKFMLRKLDKEEIQALTDETDLGDMLLAMIKKVLCITDKDAALVLRCRCLTADSSERYEMLASGEAEDILDNPGKKDFEDMAKNEEKIEEQDKAICKAIRRVSEASRSSSGPPRKRQKVQKTWPKGGHEVSLAFAETLCPPGAKIWADNRHRRFRVYLDHASCSKSWGKFGYKEAMRLCLQWAWHVHYMWTGEVCSVDGLDCMDGMGPEPGPTPPT